MKQALTALVALAVIAVPAVRADEHLLTPQAAEQQLLEATAARTRNRATVEAFVASPQGAAAIATLGVDSARVQGAVAGLSDAELADVAARAAALQGDPVAGAPFSRNQMLWIALIAAAVVVVILIL